MESVNSSQKYIIERNDRAKQWSLADKDTSLGEVVSPLAAGEWASDIATGIWPIRYVERSEVKHKPKYGNGEFGNKITNVNLAEDCYHFIEWKTIGGELVKRFHNFNGQNLEKYTQIRETSTGTSYDVLVITLEYPHPSYPRGYANPDPDVSRSRKVVRDWSLRKQTLPQMNISKSRNNLVKKSASAVRLAQNKTLYNHEISISSPSFFTKRTMQQRNSSYSAIRSYLNSTPNQTIQPVSPEKMVPYQARTGTNRIPTKGAKQLSTVMALGSSSQKHNGRAQKEFKIRPTKM
jgi:hypothetical protein